MLALPRDRQQSNSNNTAVNGKYTSVLEKQFGGFQ